MYKDKLCFAAEKGRGIFKDILIKAVKKGKMLPLIYPGELPSFCCFFPPLSLVFTKVERPVPSI